MVEAQLGVSSSFEAIGGELDRKALGGTDMVLRTLLALPAALLSVKSRSTRNAKALDDDDLACPICDHPFGHMRHACLG